MHPAPLVQALMGIVACVEVTAEHATEVLANHGFDHRPAAAVVVLVIAHGWDTSRPDVTILSIFSPSRFIHLKSRTRSYLRFECIQVRLHLFFEPMLQFYQLSNADRDSMQRMQVHLDLANGQT